MRTVYLTKRIEFAASHRYHREEWDTARNRAVFGACHNAPGHGHNYLLEVSVAGAVDAETGMVVNLYDVKEVLKRVLEEFDHKHLNHDTPYFKDKVPTTENLTTVLWTLLARCPEIETLHSVRLFEDEDLYAEIESGMETALARVTRRYEFSAAHRLHAPGMSQEENERLFGRCHRPSGHNYDLFVSVSGPIHGETGMVVDLQALDRLVTANIIERFDHRDLVEDPGLAGQVATGENLVKLIWSELVHALPAGRLDRVKLVESRDTIFEYAGEGNR